MTCRETSDHSILESFPTVQVFSILRQKCTGFMLFRLEASDWNDSFDFLPRSQPEHAETGFPVNVMMENGCLGIASGRHMIDGSRKIHGSGLAKARR